MDMNTHPVLGLEQASALAEALMHTPGVHNDFAYTRNNFCGDTVYFKDDKFHIALVENSRVRAPHVSFDSREEFVDWLAQQTDIHFMGYLRGKLKKEVPWKRNQALSAKRISNYIEFRKFDEVGKAGVTSALQR